MSLSSFIRREIHVALNGQPRIFRILKWIVIAGLMLALYRFGGFRLAAEIFGTMLLLGLALHSFLSWKTERWTKSWGLYKRIRLENE